MTMKGFDAATCFVRHATVNATAAHSADIVGRIAPGVQL